MAQTRITAGEWRGRVLETPRGMATRPTRSLIRQSLFDILGASVTGASLLDLYAGAGTVGFEALSRGAAAVTFVEHDRQAITAIEATAARLACIDRCRVVLSDVLRWVRRSAPEIATATLCFVDAPYRDPELDRVLSLVAATPPALVVCEHHRQRRIPERIGRLRLTREVRHGLTTLSFLQPIQTETT
jgi:16S rRNA (guanine966-N2)-methyltransferase